MISRKKEEKKSLYSRPGKLHLVNCQYTSYSATRDLQSCKAQGIGVDWRRGDGGGGGGGGWPWSSGVGGGEVMKEMCVWRIWVVAAVAVVAMGLGRMGGGGNLVNQLQWFLFFLAGA